MLILNSGNVRELLPGEKCGLSAVINVDEAGRLALVKSALIVHRGEVAFGAVSVHQGKFHPFKKRGSVHKRLDEVDAGRDLPGRVAIAHNRYATAGDPDARKNIQPLVWSESRFGTPLAIAHNGTLANHLRIRKGLLDHGALFQSSTDTETIAHLIAHSGKPGLEESILYALDQIRTAYSLLILTRDRLFAIRDPYGVRPLSVARYKTGFLVLSENFPFGEIAESEHLFDVKPGEMVVFPLNGDDYRRVQYAESDEHFCVFEGIYFSHPRSSYNNYVHEDFRQELGKALWEDNPDLRGDVVIPLLDSGKEAAVGFMEAADISYREYFHRMQHPVVTNGRSFTTPTTEQREVVARIKQLLRRDKIRGKAVIVVDDSIVRSHTARIAIKRLREAGAKSVTFVVSAPPITQVCPLGMDYQSKGELAAHDRTLEEVRQLIGADRLIYQSLATLNRVVAETYRCGVCTGCFGGKYPVNPA